LKVSNTNNKFEGEDYMRNILFIIMTLDLLAGSSIAAINVYVPGNAGWVSTGTIINSGEFLVINASGFVSGALGVPPGDTPDGPGFGPGSSSYLAPGLERYSLVGKIGDNAPFQVGSSFSRTVLQSGIISLAYNDEEYGDNSGGYDVTGNID